MGQCKIVSLGGRKMLLFKIVNPSDPYTIEASSLDVATVAAILLGQGKYPFESLDGGQDVPHFLFGKVDVWAKEHFNETVMELSNRVMDTKMGEVADCLDSVLYGDKEDRVEFFASTKGMNSDDFEDARSMRQDSRRSSLNDIGERAYRMAAKLRESIAQGLKTLQ
jgi:hypothetical protein